MNNKLLSLLTAAMIIVSGCGEDSDPENSHPLSPSEYPANAYLSAASLTLQETGMPVSFEVRFDRVFTAGLTVTAASSDTGECIIHAPSAVNIASGTSARTVSFTVSGIDDKIIDGNQNVTISVAVKDTATQRNLFAPLTLPVTVIDSSADSDSDDVHKPTVHKFEIAAPANLRTSENGTGIMGSIRLKSAPAADVTVVFKSSDTTEGKVTPEKMIFNAANYSAAQKFTIMGQNDAEIDGDISYIVTATAASSDPNFRSGEILRYTIVNVDDDKKPIIPDASNRIRFMAANITSGKDQSYDEEHGRNIFKAVKPDIAMIQEFNLTSGAYDQFVAEVFGPGYEYYRGTTSPDYIKQGIPNGIVSKYPIIESGEWAPVYRKPQFGLDPDYVDRPSYPDRQWCWSVIDIPGDRDLLAVSVHLHTENNRYEYEPLAEKIAAKKKEGNYYVVIGGDFNTKEKNYDALTTESQGSLFREVFYVSTINVPVDQRDNANTNSKRGSQLDWVLFDHEFNKLEIPVEIGAHTGIHGYKYGHVFDSRVYADMIYDGVSEITLVPPVQPTDCGSYNKQKGAEFMQHMAVIRDIRIPE